jgi:hypothetical protein
MKYRCDANDPDSDFLFLPRFAGGPESFRARGLRGYFLVAG